MIEEMRLVLGEQEETQTQMDLELENREAQIHQLTQGNAPNTPHTPARHVSLNIAVLFLHFTAIESHTHAL